MGLGDDINNNIMQWALKQRRASGPSAAQAAVPDPFPSPEFGHFPGPSEIPNVPASNETETYPMYQGKGLVDSIDSGPAQGSKNALKQRQADLRNKYKSIDENK